MRRPSKITALAVAAALVFAACGSEDNGAGRGTGASLDGVEMKVGSANFPEAVLLGEIYAQALAARGAKISTELNMGSHEVYYKAITDDEIQLLPEYTNSLLSFVLKAKGKSPKAKNVTEQIEALKAALPDNLTVLTPSTAEDKDVIVCTKEVAAKYKLKTLSDLARASGDITLGAGAEFADRSPFGIVGFRDIFGANFKKFVPLENGQPIVDAMKSGAIDCGNLFSTNSFITTNGFVALEDDKVIVPNEAVIPLIARAKATPEVQVVLDVVDGRLDTEQLKAMMVKVEQDKTDPAQVATDWLKENGLT